uniref:Uncharacterized protein n=1 Tax=Onchocerca volvulus TaxID=6282 RepID=A0A8R1TX12_ONCVO
MKCNMDDHVITKIGNLVTFGKDKRHISNIVMEYLSDTSFETFTFIPIKNPDFYNVSPPFLIYIVLAMFIVISNQKMLNFIKITFLLCTSSWIDNAVCMVPMNEPNFSVAVGRDQMLQFCRNEMMTFEDDFMFPSNGLIAPLNIQFVEHL